MLVAPIYDTKQNLTTRSVWIPPGKWQDAWNGSTVTGPATLSVTLPFERVPMWHRAGGGLVLALDEPGVRVDEQDWSTITLYAWPELGTLGLNPGDQRIVAIGQQGGGGREEGQVKQEV